MEQCMRLIQMAGASMNMCMQLKGCSSDFFFHHGSVAGGDMDETNSDGVQLALWTLAEWTVTTSTGCTYYFMKFVFLVAQIMGMLSLVAGVVFLLSGPLIWKHYGWMRMMTIRHAPALMACRFRLLIKPSLWLAWWMLRREICYLHDRFRESNQQGDFMTDMEGVYESLDEYLTGGQFPVGALAALEEPYVEAQPEPQLFEDVDLAEVAEAALQHVANLNGHQVDRAVRESEHINMDEETQEDRRRRYLESDQGEVSDPDEWASIHFGDRDEYDHDRLLAFSQANHLRLQNALASLQGRRAQAEEQGDWEAAATFTRAMQEIETLRDIA